MKVPVTEAILVLHVQIKNIFMATEEFEHPVEGFCNTDQHDGDNELMRHSIFIV